MKPTATPVPRHITVGLPVTYCIGSDRYAMHVHAIERGGLTLICAHGTPADEASRVAQVTERCTGRDNSTIDWQIKQGRRAFTRRADQTYRSKGPHGSGALWFGEAEDYLDPSF